MLYHCPACFERSVFRKMYTPKSGPRAGVACIFEKCKNAGCGHKDAWVVPGSNTPALVGAEK